MITTITELRSLIRSLIEESIEGSSKSSERFQLDITIRNGYPYTAELVDTETGEILATAELIGGSDLFTYRGRPLVGVSSIMRTSPARGAGKLLYAKIANWLLDNGFMFGSQSGSITRDGTFMPYEMRSGAATAAHVFMKRYGAKEVEIPNTDPDSEFVKERLYVYPNRIPEDKLIRELGLDKY
jgi:hypothetical protein